MHQNDVLAPELMTSVWLNTNTPISLQSLRGRLVFLYCFQMLCPACVSHGLPQALRVADTFPSQDVIVIGLHTVFEHHEAINKTALQAFLNEYRVRFPVGIDRPHHASDIPLTMQRFGLHGTPSLLLIDWTGRTRLHHFGIIGDMELGKTIGQLLTEKVADNTEMSSGKNRLTPEPNANMDAASCNDLSCRLT